MFTFVQRRYSYPLIKPEDQATFGVKPCHLYMILGHRYFFHTISTFTNLSLGVICKIIRSRDHLSSFCCTGIRAYNGKTKSRPSPLLLTNDIIFDWYAILWLVKRSTFYHCHMPVPWKDFKWLPHKTTFKNLSLGVICKIIWS